MRIFITGISSGIGRELTKLLIKQGHEVWGVAQHAEQLASLSHELSSPLLRTSVCDITQVDQVQQVCDDVENNNFSLDCVILNAAIDREDLNDNFDFTEGKNVLRTNIEGALVWVDKFLPKIKKHHGQFIAVSSIFANWPDITSVSYGTSKAALNFAFRTFRLKFAKLGIRFKTLYLGPVATLINPRFAEVKETFLVVSPQKVAKFIIKVMTSNGNNFYFPWHTKLTRICLWWLPDKWFEALTRKIRR